MANVDIVVVSFNSADHLRGCVAPLVGLPGVDVIVVDNASVDGSLETIADLPLTTIARPTNGGFAAGCNAGWRAGQGFGVLFLNPDATIDSSSLAHLVSVLQDDDRVGAVAPKLQHDDGSLVCSLRRFPRLRSAFARALYLHRLFPEASWSDEVVRDEKRYLGAGEPEWVSGACILVRRRALVELGGWDEGYFLYSEDVDLCRRLWDAGWRIRFEPEATAVHAGGASAPRAALLPVLVESRLRYARRHGSRPYRSLARVALALHALTHMVAARGGMPARVGHARSFARALRRTQS